MEVAIEEAKLAMLEDEVPVGAVVVYQDKIIARAHNRTISLNDPTAHAEILAIRKAAKYFSNYRLIDCILISTLEPCIMCAGAMVNARIDGLVFGARDPKGGAIYSKMDFLSLNFLNHRFWIKEGVFQDICGSLLKDFFKAKRM